MGKQISGGTFSGWNGKDDHLPVGVSQSGSYKFRSLVYFSVSFAGMQTVTDAVLYFDDDTTGSNLHSIQSSSPSTINTYRVTSDWGEGGTDPGEGQLTGSLTWDWDNMHDKYTTSGSNSKSITQTSNGHQQSINVFDIVNSWKNGASNFGIMLVNSNETSISKGMQFFSRNIGGDDRPTLVITYTSNTAPNAPTGLTPSFSVVNSLSPILSGTRDDPDTGDYISMAQAQVYGPMCTYMWSTSTTASDPGAGYIRVGTGAQFYASEKNKNGGTVNFYDLMSSTEAYIVARADPTRWVHLATPVSLGDAGAWDTGTFTTKTTNGTLTADEDVFLIMDLSAQLYWDSLGVSIVPTGQTTFSFPYGFSGSPTPLLGNVAYAWRAKTKDSGALWGPMTTLKIFKANTPPNVPTVTVLSTPSNDINDSTPSFYIKHNDNDVADQLMYGYQVQVSKWNGSYFDVSAGWDSGNVDLSGAPVATVTLDSVALTFGGQYRVSARTQDSSGTWGNFSSGVSFQIHKAGIPIDLQPSQALTSTSPVFTGSVASSADVITAYTIAVYTADLQTTMLSPTRYTTGIVGGGTGFSKAYAGSALSAGASYVWNVFIETASGDQSNSSANQTFIVADASIPDITAPLGDNAYTITPTITGTRAAVYNRFKYEIYPSTSVDTVLGTPIYQSASLSATISGAGPTTFSVAYGGSPALTYGTKYRIRAAVSADAGSTWSSWSGLQTFLTASASIGTPNSPADNAWITDSTPDFYVNRGGADTIDKFQVNVWDSTVTNLIWDSTMTDVTNGTTNVGPITYAGPTLTPGLTYKWNFRYTNTSNGVGGYSVMSSFRLNGAPTVPNDLYPTPSQAFPDTLFPIFRATFADPEQNTHGDYPTKWSIRILDSGGSTLTTKELTTSLVAGTNQYVWQSGDYSLSANTDYQWQTWFTDSKSAVGAISAPSAFKLGISPNGTITSPTNNSTLSSSVHTVTWTYSGGTQAKYRISVYNVKNGVTDSLRWSTDYRNSAATSHAIPSGILKDRQYYDIVLDVTNTELLPDPSPSQVRIQVILDAPNPITGLSVTTIPNLSMVTLDWDPWIHQSGHTFRWYEVERRMVGDEDFTHLTNIESQGTSEYTDWFAGNDVNYEYRVTVNTTKSGALVQSPDDPNGGNLATGKLSADTWMFIGTDRASEHIAELFVNDEDHERPIQQESFETLGSNRKVVVRGFVLGNEGNFSMTYQGSKLVSLPSDAQKLYEETVLGRRLVDYLTFNKGPHILKSPFGDVWAVEFSSPKFKWLQGGHLQVDLSWVETGQTSKTGSI
jgi:hypothetical protein